MEQTKLGQSNDKDLKEYQGTEKKIIAHELAKAQRQINVAEFFAKNRHLLGFDNKRKALLTTIKEAVDNSLDACEEAEILPEISVEIIDLTNDRFKVIVEDNGPGIVKKQIPNIFARLLYGSKFHKLAQSLTGEQELIIERNGNIEITTIGKFCDKYIGNKEGKKEIIDDQIRVPAFDPKTYKYTFKPVSHAIKHKQQNEIYEIELETGRKIRVTGCHSVFHLNKDIKTAQVEARKLKAGNHIIVPKQLPEPETKNEINILDYINIEETRKKWWYLYGIKKEEIMDIFGKSQTIHKKTSKSRRFYRFKREDKIIDVLDESYKQYLKKGFLPLYLALSLKIQIPKYTWIQTYQHGKETRIPTYWPITKQLTRFLGLFVAEGHSDKRQVGFTFGGEEKHLVKEVSNFAISHGMNYTIENRPEKNCIRVKVFGSIIANIIPKWCGKGAKNKKIPSFIFSANYENRQHFIDGLYDGDGHDTKRNNQLIHITVSKRLANELQYLWLFQEVIASQSTRITKGLGRNPSTTYVTTVYGKDIEKTYSFTNRKPTKRSKFDFVPKALLEEHQPKYALSTEKQIYSSIGLGYSEEQYQKFHSILVAAKETTNKEEIKKIVRFNEHNINYLQQKGFISVQGTQVLLTEKYFALEQKINKIQKFLASDLRVLKIRSIKKVDLENQWVYDISVPGYENFVAGQGGIAAHNTRGQQGIGISAAVMYGQLTTGKPAKIMSKIHKSKPANCMDLQLDTKTNKPKIKNEHQKDWPEKDHGTRIEIDLEGSYQKGGQSVDQYIKQTAIVNPHATFIYTNPKAEQYVFPRATEQKTKKPVEIKPHPYGVELGVLLEMAHFTDCRTLQSFFTTEFTRVGPGTAKEICKNAALLPNTKPKTLSREQAEKLIEGIKKTRIISPPTDCISPIGHELLEKGIKKEVNAEFYCATTRPPSVYRGNPFVVECAIAYGGEQRGDSSITIYRYANRVPLLFQQSAGVATKSIIATNWRSYGLSQSTGSIPIGPVTVVVHVASVWVPFTSESKEAIAHYPEILKEIRLAVQECGRKLGSYIHKKKRVGDELKKRSYIEKYIPHVAAALQELLAYKDSDKKKVEDDLKVILEKKRGKIDDMKFDKTKNVEYDEKFANIGKEEKKEEAKEGEEAKAA